MADDKITVITRPANRISVNPGPGNKITVNNQGSGGGSNLPPETYDLAIAGYAQANAAYLQANAAYDTANNAVTDYSPAFHQANAAYTKANSANLLAYNTGIGANAYTNYVGASANAYAASLTPDLSPAFNQANAAYAKANAANVLAYDTGIGANTYAVSVGASANAYANGRFLANVTGTFAGDLTATGWIKTNNTGNTSYPAIQFGQYQTGLWEGSYLAELVISGSHMMRWTQAGGQHKVEIPSDGVYSWNSNDGISGTTDLFLYRDAANTLAQRNGTAAQTFNIYKTYTDPSNYARLTLDTTGLFISAAGTGVGAIPFMVINAVNADLYAYGGFGKSFILGANDSYNWKINSSGHFLAYADASYDIGASGANRPRNLYISGNYNFGGDLVKTSGDNFNLIVNSRTIIGGGGSGVQTIRATSTGLNIIHTDTDATRLFISDNIGIGTVSPSTKLHVIGDATFTGNVYVSGNTTYMNTQTLLIGDNILTLNADLPGNLPPLENAGLEINRGSSANTSLLWDETNDRWTFTNDGSSYVSIASNTDVSNTSSWANGKFLANTTGTFAGDLTITGNTSINGRNVTFNGLTFGNLNYSAYVKYYPDQPVFGIGYYGGNYGVSVTRDVIFGWGDSGNSESIPNNMDLYLSRPAAATLQLGMRDGSGFPLVAQTLRVQSASGVSDTAGANFTIQGSAGTGTGAGGSIIFQVAPAGTSGTAKNAYATALTIGSDKNATFESTIITKGTATLFGQSGGVNRIYLAAWNGTINIMDNGTGYYGFSGATDAAGGTVDLKLNRDAAGVLAQRNDTANQSFRIYNTYTDSSNYERGVLDWRTTANTFTIGTQSAGTGVARSVALVAGGNTAVTIAPDKSVGLSGSLYGPGYGGDGNALIIGTGIATVNIVPFTDGEGGLGTSSRRWASVNLFGNVNIIRDGYGIVFGASSDALLTRDAADTLALRRSTNAQRFNIYNTYTDPSNYERGYIAWAGNALYIGTEAAGTGSNRGIYIGSSSTGLTINSTTTLWAPLNVSGGYATTLAGTLNFSPDNSVDIGQVTSSRPRNVYIAGNLVAATKSFDIVHPSNPTKRLRYGSVEAPYHGVRLTGKGKLTKGKGCIILPDYIKDLCKQEGSQVQITNIKHGKVIWVEELDINNHNFTVRSESKKTLEFYWSFTGIRKDVETLIVEYDL